MLSVSQSMVLDRETPPQHRGPWGQDLYHAWTGGGPLSNLLQFCLKAPAQSLELAASLAALCEAQAATILPLSPVQASQSYLGGSPSTVGM